jgi:hypothetical protein
MADETKKPKEQERSEDTRPVPSQAEGDEETIDRALEQHEKQQTEKR